MRPVTVSSINDEIKEIEDCIVEYQNAIKNKRLELTEKKRLLKKLEKYQELFRLASGEGASAAQAMSVKSTA